eukprot:TRINITY_DN1757_c0_g1_i1.p1 TRINITY_DN1757_c0_g1~~TRINITY_DN1757_c0_g1_i1.p1  ORF type:complete len:163 (+),score=48.24 TRINITY_DN1757_c0_g1_i1:106-594(+)
MNEIGVNKLINPNPVIYDIKEDIPPAQIGLLEELEPCDIFDIIRDIKDPEHPYTLEELRVIQEEWIEVRDKKDDEYCYIKIEFCPTVPHCSLATLIGLCIRIKLNNDLPREDFKLDIYVTPGKHDTELEINKQINDKERVQAAFENPNLKNIVMKCISEDTY